jgi:serine/threonine protein phosphatase PrpC
MNFLRRMLGMEDDASPSSEPPRDTEAEIDDEPIHTPVEIPGVGSMPAPEPQPQPAETAEEGESFGITRQLPPLESALSRPNQHVMFGQRTDVGMVRGTNQDAILTFVASQGNIDNVADFGLFIVADGMGGHHDGEKASTIASREVAETITNEIYLPLLKQEYQFNGADQPTISEIMTDAVKHSNDVVVRLIPEGGTTITVAAVVGDLAYIVHVGDSRAYLLTKEHGLEQITRDHSLVQRLIELDQLTPEEAAQHPQKNVLYRAIGQSDNLEVDAVTRRLPADSRLLLCSDGLWNMVTDHEIEEIVSSPMTPQSACDRLIAVANERGGSDNISAILLQISG